jgi:hypothetical protein
MDRLVEDLIQESMAKGEFDNLSGKGKPLPQTTENPYVDFVTHKINQASYNFEIIISRIVVSYFLLAGPNRQWFCS